MIQQREHLRYRLAKEDLNSEDIMAYSTVNAEDGSDDSSLFGEGGAIMAALQEKDPSLKPKPAPKKNVTKPAVKKPTKAEIEKQKKEAAMKKKAKEEAERKAKIELDIKQKK